MHHNLRKGSDDANTTDDRYSGICLRIGRAAWIAPVAVPCTASAEDCDLWLDTRTLQFDPFISNGWWQNASQFSLQHALTPIGTKGLSVGTKRNNRFDIVWMYHSDLATGSNSSRIWILDPAKLSTGKSSCKETLLAVQ